MQNKNRVACIIPCFNRGENVELVMHGLLNQSILPDEIIIVDDGSTDDTLLRLLNNGWLDLDEPNVIYYRHKNRGYRVSFNRNQGTRIASKDITHFWFIDSDVVLNPKAVEAFHDIANEHPDVVIAGRYDWLPPMKVTPRDIELNFDKFASGGLNAE